MQVKVFRLNEIETVIDSKKNEFKAFLKKTWSVDDMLVLPDVQLETGNVSYQVYLLPHLLKCLSKPEPIEKCGKLVRWHALYDLVSKIVYDLAKNF